MGLKYIETEDALIDCKLHLGKLLMQAIIYFLLWVAFPCLLCVVCWSLLMTLTLFRFCHVIRTSSCLVVFLDTPQPVPWQCHLHHLLCTSNQILGERLQVSRLSIINIWRTWTFLFSIGAFDLSFFFMLLCQFHCH